MDILKLFSKTREFISLRTRVSYELTMHKLVTIKSKLWYFYKLKMQKEIIQKKNEITVK